VSVRARVIALGQAARGDDGVGPAVLDELHRRGVPADVELRHAPDATAVLPLLETRTAVLIVDAAVGPQPGEVIELEPDDLPGCGARPISSHGIGLGEVVALARSLDSGHISPSIRIVAVTIAQPDTVRTGLSAAAAAAVDRAADRILQLVGGQHLGFGRNVLRRRPGN
jgi:hydrogenase maturation protease